MAAQPEARYRCSKEYISLLRGTWTEPGAIHTCPVGPFDHEGESYRTRGTYSQIRQALLEHEDHSGGRLGAMRTGLTIGPP
jgi:alkanesulfonate monooxygenase SsuD/methylene tetrahydromethanopterin reductase-like flavin-dependent oxidoreductase (luciferase family)